MKVTTITYQRVLNLGDYNSCRLEKTALADEFEDQEIATQNLIESVLRQLHDSAIQNQIDTEIRTSEKQLAALKAEYAALSKEVELLKAQQTSLSPVVDDRF
ncbi:MAG: hypothetical protein HWQ43_32585 [Nostoc sp. JL31]|uniref:hypothetical protein n=1 Tax=Nostoc sp. JL31 TaxID=2815395 RepID=UPI0025E207BA|nr:hypothetical protein [Nostoc sp. JL31]MBN3893653.1 hypothetical protein [Nostoc sp. JL31]